MDRIRVNHVFKILIIVTIWYFLYKIESIQDASIEGNFYTFKIKYDKRYASAREEAERKKDFEKNMKLITEHNEKYDRGLAWYRMGINNATDRSPAELKENLGLAQKMSNPLGQTTQMSKDVLTRNSDIFKDLGPVPDEYDWRKHNAVTEMKSQFNSPYCWIFSAIAAVEGRYSIVNGELLNFSEQQIVDCEISNPFNQSGFPENVYEHFKNNNIATTENYGPLSQVNKEQQCKLNNVTSMNINMNGYYRIESDEETIKRAVYKLGPLSASMYVYNPHFKFYKSGVFKEDNCNQPANHAVTIIGYGTDENGHDYWLIKNSWSKDWGENGYGKIARNNDNHCRIADDCKSPIMTKMA
ncbi:uncharacterized protein LOC109597230 [Aethina tumida]|uniref:uncharacterized protein LOC109597230 n=1 Tax=Aethina tumida TaxID=116153 RepID=UPI002147A4B9|nr:uncharacterized protein LOC109597230 [Aethina tumida]